MKGPLGRNFVMTDQKLQDADIKGSALWAWNSNVKIAATGGLGLRVFRSEHAH